jgi:N-acetylglucosaminyldiphosphoundecaprenol N-acetyl-beta-D-mannosaminyltransferase
VKFRFAEAEIKVSHSTASSLLGEVLARLGCGQGFALATINLDHLVKLSQDAAFRAAYAAQDIIVADGNPIVWLSRLAGRPVELMPGSDLILPLARAAARQGRPLSIVGASDEALMGAAARLAALVPRLKFGLLYAPPMGFDPQGPEARRILERLTLVGPGLCLVALGAPKQERFAALGRCIAPQTGFASVGAGVEFLSGHQSRAPLWVRSVAMEWLWRTVTAPRRLLPRYVACLAILPGQALEALRQRQRHG